MEKDFRKVIEEIKESTVDPEETKKYILMIKSVFRKAFENCKDEYSEAEILDMCLEQYDKDLEFRGNARKIFNNMLMYDTYKKILGDSEHNKSAFRSAIQQAKRQESENNAESIVSKFTEKDFVLSAIRYVLRKSNARSEKEIIDYIKKDRSRISKELKSDMIRVIQSSVATLEEYGVIDEYIKLSNEELVSVGLEELKLRKRNPIPDEQYENGELVENVEDIGLLDIFSTESLSNMSIEELEIMTIFYESKYLQERLGLSKAMSTIKTLNLWDTIFYGEDEDIQNLDNSSIENALKRDLALTYLSKNGIKITPRINRKYKEFLNHNNIESDMELKDEVELAQLETQNLSSAAEDIGILECLLARQLKEKYIKMKKWGIIKNNQEIVEDDEMGKVVTIAMESEKFRGALLIDILEKSLIDFLGEKDLKFPDYKGNLDEVYCNIMSRLYLPANKFYETTIRKLYNQNPQSKLIASLAGKKVKEGR